MSRAKTGAQDAASSNAFRLPPFHLGRQHPIRAQEAGIERMEAADANASGGSLGRPPALNTTVARCGESSRLIRRYPPFSSHLPVATRAAGSAEHGVGAGQRDAEREKAAPHEGWPFTPGKPRCPDKRAHTADGERALDGGQ